MADSPRRAQVVPAGRASGPHWEGPAHGDV